MARVDVGRELPTHNIKMNAWEMGLLTKLIWDCEAKDELMGIFNQIIEARQVIRDEDGVTIEKLPDGRIKMVDNQKNVIIRPPYEWEK